jgi:hypothetical protein
VRGKPWFRRSEKELAEQVTEREKDQDHDRHNRGDEAHHLEKL